MKKICMELNDRKKADGFSMLANLSADYVKAVKRLKKDLGKDIAQAIRNGNAKKAVECMCSAIAIKNAVNSDIAKHNKIIYYCGKSWGMFEVATRTAYKFESEET